MRTIIKIERAGRGQILIDVCRKMDVKERDILAAEIKGIFNMEASA